MKHTEKYTTHLKSEAWSRFRRSIISERGQKCEACGNEGTGLQLHHLTYERLGDERPSDVQLLCWMCHRKADEKREREARIRSERSLYDARLNGWAKRKYGEEWDYYHDTEQVSEEFDAWVESRE
jgi:hypothetical protein